MNINEPFMNINDAGTVGSLSHIVVQGYIILPPKVTVTIYK